MYLLFFIKFIKLENCQGNIYFMSKNTELYNSDTLIQVDKMKLAITNIYPTFQKNTEQEIRQDISAKLYQIFKKYT